MRSTRRNERYLPGIVLPRGAGADQRSRGGARACARRARHRRHADGRRWPASCAQLPARDAPPLLWLSKGFEPGSGRLGHEVAQALRPGSSAGVISGPSFALEVARGQPTALVAASERRRAAPSRRRRRCTARRLRVYTSTDPVGVEVGGAVKNVLALATGIADGMDEVAGSA